MFTAGKMVVLGGDEFRDEYSLAFDGTDDHIRTSFTPDFIHTNATFVTWIKMGDFSGDQTMGAHGAKRWYFGFKGTGGFIGVQDTNTASSPITITPTPTSGKWMHYATTAIGGTATLYINGVAQGTLSYTQASGSNPADGFVIAGRNTNSTSGGAYAETIMNCNISEVAQYDVGLTAAQITTLYNGREPYDHKNGILSGNLQSWLRMGDGLENFSGTTIYDMSVNSANGTMTNMDAVDFEGDTP